MIRGLYIAGTSMVTNSLKIDAVSNNIANIDTAGYKRDDVTTESFNDVLMAKLNGSDYRSEGLSDTIDVENEDGDYEATTKLGFFRISTDTGISHNKDVKFTTDEDGYLSTYYLNSDQSKNWNLGDRLVGRSGDFIQVGTDGFEVDDSGAVLVNGETVDYLTTGTAGNIIGTLNAGVKLNRVFTDYTQGQMLRTDERLDFALEGDGFFVVSTPYGEMYTRNGQFKTDASRKLMTTEGYSVQGFNGEDIYIDGEDISVNEFGEILQDDQIIDKFKLTDVTNKGDLVKLGGGYYRMKNDPAGTMKNFEGRVYQNFKEQSNADSITEMISMMQLQRNYEASQRVILTHDNMLDKAVNAVGRIG